MRKILDLVASALIGVILGTFVATVIYAFIGSCVDKWLLVEDTVR